MLMTLAFRNLSRNRRRTIATVLAIALGFMSVALFGGYITNVYSGLSRQAIQGEKLGHLTIAKPGYFSLGNINQENYIFTSGDQAKIRATIGSMEGVELISPRLSISGLVSNGEQSTIFIGDGIVRNDLRRIRKDFRPESGGFLDEKNPVGVALSRNLAKALELQKGETGVLFVSTLSGQANALDFDVVDVYDTGNAATNDKAVILPFDMAQTLLDTQGAERITVVLSDESKTAAVREKIIESLGKAGLNVEIKTWEELSSFYRQVRNLFNMIFSFIFSIVLVIVIMSIINTMSMVVMERTREIGTLRSIGMQRGSLVRLFAFEGFLLGLIGCAAGLALTIAIGSALNAAEFTYTPPNSSSQVRLLIDFEPRIIAVALVALCLFSIASSFVPARKSAHANITEALRYV
jgi:putative ABC transport system permease protein